MKRFLLLSLASILFFSGSLLHGDEPKSRALSELEAAKQKLSTKLYDLKYKFTAGEVVRWKAVQRVTVETKIEGVSETAKTYSSSIKRWRVISVDPEGKTTFLYTIDAVDMWQSVSGRAVIRYNSETDKEPPAVYRHVAGSVGIPLATVTINTNGQITKRENERPQMKPWIGELVLPMPGKPVKIGYQWAVPEEMTVRLPDGTGKRVKMRQLYKLEKVAGDLATISAQTQILTPIKNPKIKSQMIQRMKRGNIQFDMKKGRLVSKLMDLDETVFGFSGAESIMQYLARFTEETLPDDRTATKVNASREAKRRADKPKLRR